MKLELTGSLTDAHGTMNADELTTLVASRSPSPGTPSIVPASGDRDAVVDLIAVLAVGGCAVPVDPQSSAEDQAELATRLGLSSGYDMPDLTSTALVLSSSGSNGRPKLVRHSLDSTLVGVAVYRQRFGITPDDVVLLAVPWCHSFGLIAGLLTAVSSGARVVVLPRITPPAVHEAVARENATVLLCTPLLVDLLVRTASAASYRGLRVAISSGSPLSASRRDAFESRFGCRVVQAYGSTETGVLAIESDLPCPGHLGPLVDGVEARCEADGTLMVRTPGLFQGYVGAPACHRRGYYDTGDIAVCEPDGCITLQARKRTFINVGGKKVNPSRVADILTAHPAVVQARVFGMDAGEEQVVGAEVAAEGVTVAELLTHCRERLLSYEVPYTVRIMRSLPTGGLDKVRADA